MSAPLVVVSGTGTGIGKTHFAASLVGAWARMLHEAGKPSAVAGLKPIESGVPEGGEGEDGATLGHMSTFHVKRFPAPYMLVCPVSPHLAARRERRIIDVGAVVSHVASVRAEADAVAVELPGGLFSPLATGASNADLALALSPSALILVAPDRLGVLHDVAAATRAATSMGLPIHGLVLATPAPETADPSTGTNADELPLVAGVPLLATLPRASVADLSASEPVRGLVLDLGLL